MAHTGPAQSGRRWSMNSFTAFWSRPDATLVAGVLTQDVVGHWPRPIGTVRGSDDYVNVIAAILRVCPDFRLAVPEHASSGSFTFVRWIATGTDADGKFEFTGCDRVATRDGLVYENYIFSDHPFFERVAAEMKANRGS